MLVKRVEPKRRRHRLRRLILWLAALAVVFHVGGGWYFAGVLHDRAFSGAERRASTDFIPHLEVAAITDGAIVLRPLDGATTPASVDAQGVWGLRWNGGYGLVGQVTSVEGADVARSFELVEGDPPLSGMTAQLDARAAPDIDHLPEPLDYREVVIGGPLGALPAWYASAQRTTWVVTVHGNGLSRLDAAKWLPALQMAGYPTLTFAYRNAAGAPEDPSGLLRYGLTEWEDLDAAVRYALDHGATDVALFGYSMGGGVAAAFLQRSTLAGSVRALVLDAPMLNFSSTVDDNAAREPLVGPVNVPPSLTWSAKAIADVRYDIDWGSLDYLVDPALFSMPTLVLHGDHDLTVPIRTSRMLAMAAPGTVTLVECPGVDHLECWNQDPETITARVVSFLDAAT